MSGFVCPVCGGILEREERTYRCPLGHSFDVARQNYVNLLLPNRSGAQDPGDSQEMVEARARFLGGGYYRPLAETLGTLCGELSGGNPVSLLDAGCGEGTYLETVARQLPPGSRCVGIDLSRPALRRAGKRIPQAEFAVASLFHLPLGDGSVDLVLHVFAPPAPEEFARVLRRGGTLVSVTPGPRHLWGLKTALYEQPYENDGEVRPMGTLVHRRRVKTQGTITVTPGEDIAALYHMTPYAWRSPRESARRLLERERLETPFEFQIDLYEKA